MAKTLTVEPNKQLFPVLHTFWQQLRKVSDIRSVDVSEAETIIDYARDHNVQPHFQEKVGE